MYDEEMLKEITIVIIIVLTTSLVITLIVAGSYLIFKQSGHIDIWQEIMERLKNTLKWS